jgi:Rrf2 family nitric oxide-sensitive transcriptional repressor
MQLTYHTDYALRLLMYLALKADRLATVEEVATAFGISRNHMMKVAHGLGQAGYVETLRGRTGGLRLNRKAESIRIGDVIRDMEEGWRMVECFDAERNTCVIAGPCRLKGVLKEALAAYMAVLDRHTLADLMGSPAQLGRKLGLADKPDAASQRA